MRILHVLAERGHSGGEVQLGYVLEHLQRSGHDNRLIAQPGAAMAREAERLGVRVISLRMRNSADLLACWQLRKLVRRSAPDLVHFACSRAHKLGALALLGRADPARVVTRRMDYPLRCAPWSRWLYGSAVDAAVVISRGVRAELERVGVPEGRIVLIYEGVDPARFAALARARADARRELGLPAGAVVVLCAASLTWRKGQIHLLRAFAEVAARVPDAHLLLAGEGPERTALEAACAELGLAQRVSLPGRVAATTALAAAEVACMPSLREGLSVFCLEAQAAGLPVVASRIGGLPEAVADGETGILVAPGDEVALAAALERLVADGALRSALGEAARRRARQQFDAADMARRTEACYRDVVARHRGGGA